MYKHYVRIDENNNIIKAFSNAFEQPDTSTGSSDILINDKAPRQFILDLFTEEGAYKYKYNSNPQTGEDYIQEQTETEIENQLGIDYYKNKKKDEVDSILEQEMGKGFTWDSDTFIPTSNNILKWMAVKLNQSNVSFPRKITKGNRSKKQVTSVQFDDFFQTGMDKIVELEDRAAAIVDEIDALTTIQEVKDYTIDFYKTGLL